MHATPVAHRLCIDDAKSLLALLKSDNKSYNKTLIIILYLLSDFGVVGIVFKLMVYWRRYHLVIHCGNCPTSNCEY